MGKSHFQLIILIEPMLRVIGATLILTWRHYAMIWSHYNIDLSNGLPWNIVWNPIKYLRWNLEEYLLKSYGISYEILQHILWDIPWAPMEYPIGYPMDSYAISYGTSYEISNGIP